MKKTMAILLLLALLVSVTACVNYKTSTTTTTSTTDADGNVVTTTTTSSNDNGKVTESTETVTNPAEKTEKFITCAAAAEDGEVHSFPYRLENQTKCQVKAFYTVPTGGDYTGAPNILGESIMEPGKSVGGDFNYNKDNLVFDFIIIIEGRDPIKFQELDFSNLRADTDTLALYLTENEDGSLHLGT